MITAAKKIKNPFKSIYYIVVAGFVLTIHDGIIKSDDSTLLNRTLFKGLDRTL